MTAKGSSEQIKSSAEQDSDRRKTKQTRRHHARRQPSSQSTENYSVTREVRDRQVEAMRQHDLFTSVTGPAEQLFLQAFINAFDTLTGAERMHEGRKLTEFKATVRKVESKLSPSERTDFNTEFIAAKDRFYQLLYREVPSQPIFVQVTTERQEAEAQRFQGLSQSLAPLLAGAGI